MIRRIFSLLLIISGLAIVMMASAFYILNTKDPLIGFEQYRLTPDPPDNPDHLTATFIGTSTLLFSDGSNSIMIDGFFTRPDIKSLLWGSIQSDLPLIKSSLARLKVDKLESIMVVHSHHDHAMDAPEVAKLTNAVVFGSESTANIARGKGLPEAKIEVVDNNRTLQFGQFNVTMIKSKHSPVPSVMAKVTGIGENIVQPLPAQPRLTDFKEGGSYVVHIAHPLGNILVQASSGYVDDLLTPYQADVIFLGIAGLSKQSNEFKQAYFNETIDAVGAKIVVPIHWDNFMLPINKALLPPHPLVDNISETLASLSSHTQKNGDQQVMIMQAWESVELY